MEAKKASRREALAPHTIEAISARLAALASPSRIALLQALREGERSVQVLADAVDLTHRNASGHLAVLFRAGLLTRRTEGTSTFYAIEDWSAWWFIEQAARSVSDDDA